MAGTGTRSTGAGGGTGRAAKATPKTAAKATAKGPASGTRARSQRAAAAAAAAPPAETLTFTTAVKEPVRQPIPVTFCGDEWIVQRPKDAVLVFASMVAAENVSDAERAAAVTQFLQGTLVSDQWARFIARAIDVDDPVNLTEARALVEGLLERWTAWPARGRVDPLVIEPVDGQHTPSEPVRLVHTQLDIDVLAHRPKNLILLMVIAAQAAHGDLGQHMWAVSTFLDASLGEADRQRIAFRMRSRHDELDVEHVVAMVDQLAHRWGDEAQGSNRAQRRAAARGR